MKLGLLPFIVSLVVIHCVDSFRFPNFRRNLKQYYFETDSPTELGWESADTSDGNPLKGFMVNPTFSNFDPNVTSIDASLDKYYVALNSVMKADPDVVGMEEAFDWTALEELLEASASRNRHAVLTFLVHYPKRPLYLPLYLREEEIPLHPYTSEHIGSGLTPDYGNPRLLRAIELFIQAFGSKYDGDTRIGYIILGLLGFWGEWHTYPFEHVPEESRVSVVGWYHKAFKVTKLQTRYPFQPAYEADMGLSDGSFAYNTLDGEANGGHFNDKWYLWPVVKKLGHEDFWRKAPMGGETRPELQPTIFEPTYPAGTFKHQDFIRCLYTTHATFMFHMEAFAKGGYQGEELENAFHAHTRLGYNYMVSRVAAAESMTLGEVNIDVTVKQVGVAPFYYPLSLVLDCGLLLNAVKQEGVETIIDAGDEKIFSFTGIPASSACLDEIILSLDSPYAYDGRPVKFAQRSNDATGFVHLKVPQPYGVSDSILESGVGQTDQISFTLMKVDVNRKGEALQSLKNGDTIDLSEYGDDLTVVADADDNVASVKFYFDGTTRRERKRPFTLAGDSQGKHYVADYLSRAGNKTISAMAYDETSTPIGRYTVSFIIQDRPPTESPKISPTASTLTPTTEIPTTSPTASTLTPTSAPVFQIKPIAAVSVPEQSVDIIKTASPLVEEDTSDEMHGFNIPYEDTTDEMHGFNIPYEDTFDDIHDFNTTDEDTFDDMHGFNTPYAPELLEIVDSEGEYAAMKSKAKLSKGGVAGIVILVLTVFTVLAVGIFFIRRKQPADQETTEMTLPSFIFDGSKTGSRPEDDPTVTGESTTSSVRTLLKRESTLSTVINH